MDSRYFDILGILDTIDTVGILGKDAKDVKNQGCHLCQKGTDDSS